VVCATALLAFLPFVKYGLAVHRAKNEHRTFAIVSALPIESDPFRYIEAASDGVIDYRRAEEDFASVFLTSLQIPASKLQANGWVLFTRHSEERYTASMDSAELRNALALSQELKVAKDFPLLPAAVIVGIALGFALVPHVLFPALVAVCVTLACLWRVVLDCESCNTYFPSSVVIAAVGAVLYGALSLALLFTPLQSTLLKISLVVFGGGLLLQLGLQYIHSQKCAPCAVAALMLALIVGSYGAFWERWKRICQSRISLRLAAGILLPALAIVPLAIAVNREVVPSNRFGSFAGLTTVTGRTIQSVLGPALSGTTGVLAILVTECPPCESAKKFLMQHPELSVKIFDADRIGAGGKPVIDTSLLRGSPTLLLVDANGIIRDELVGWGNGAWWDEGVLLRIRRFQSGILSLQHKTPSGVIRR